jgi:hypothetical protein
MAIINKYGGINNINYDEFIYEYPEGNNVLYIKLKKMNNINTHEIEKILA